jgi:hypothetical protein
MVGAILEGRKRQTRRVIKGEGIFVSSGAVDGHGVLSMHGGDIREVRCPYGAVSDRLWVRETFRECPPDQDGSYIEYRADRPEYRKRDDDPSALAWTPSIYMPRWASRITLEVTGVRVERLQDISAEDAKAEGLSFVADGGSSWGVPGFASTWWDDPRRSFQGLWTEINGAPSWFANPWVWVVEFKLL